MIHFNNNLKQSDAQWVLNVAFPVIPLRVYHPHLSILMQAHNMVFEEQVGIPGCDCEYLSIHKVWSSRLEQFKSQIEEKANG